VDNDHPSALIPIAWLISRSLGYRSAPLQKIFFALSLQAAAAIGISFASGNLALSLILGATILFATGWMSKQASVLSVRRLTN
jgi:hypothetical protein